MKNKRAGSTGRVSSNSARPPATYRKERARAATKPPAKPPPGALWPAKKKYTDSAIIDGNSTRVATSTMIERFAARSVSTWAANQRRETAVRIGRRECRTNELVRKTSEATPSEAMISTMVSPIVSQARKSTRITFTVFKPCEISSARRGIGSEINGAVRAFMANNATVTTENATAIDSQARKRLNCGLPRHSTLVGIFRSTNMKMIISTVSTSTWVKARSGAPYMAKINAKK